MKDTDIVSFLPSEEIYPKAKALFKTEKRKLQILFPDADIQHVGGSAIPGAIGKFDIDIQIRVSKEAYTDVLETLRIMYKPKHPLLWNYNFAIFMDYSDVIDYVVTVIGSSYDDFYRVRDYFLSCPNALQKYNDFKRLFEGKPYAEYRKAKQEYFGGNGSVKFLTY